MISEKLEDLISALCVHAISVGAGRYQYNDDGKADSLLAKTKKDLEAQITILEVENIKLKAKVDTFKEFFEKVVKDD